MEKRGIILTIEGTDGSGKKTQTQRLVKRAEEAGYNVGTMAFPDDNGKWGKRVRQKYLTGEYGKIGEVDIFHASILYANDRESNKETIEEKLEAGGNWIFDRYMESNFAHQGSKVKGRKRKQLIKWLEDLEVKYYEMPPSDHVIFLDLPLKYSIEAMKAREKLDIHESKISHLKQAYATYKLLSKRENWTTIPCVKKTLGLFGGRRYTEDELSDKIWRVAQELLVK